MTVPARYVFVAGLHRSGTSLLARLIAAHPDVASIQSAPVPEDEGAYLQGAIPHTALHGRPGHFATDPAQHHVEGGRYDTLETATRLARDWAPWFDPEKLWRVEKSPVNLTRMRLYQQLFPTCQFVAILRHPRAVAAATRKWTEQSDAALVAHWLEAHARLAADLPYLHAALVIRYEDLCARPAAYAAALAAFLDLPPPPAPGPLLNRNADYAAAPEPAADLGRWGYGLDFAWSPGPVHLAHPLRSVRAATAAALAGTGQA